MRRSAMIPVASPDTGADTEESMQGLVSRELKGEGWSVHPVAGDAYMMPPHDADEYSDIGHRVDGKKLAVTQKGGVGVDTTTGGVVPHNGASLDREDEDEYEDALDAAALREDEVDLMKRAAQEASNSLIEGLSEEELLRRISNDVGRAAKLRLHARIRQLSGGTM